jgi:hypothetical protein
MDLSHEKRLTEVEERAKSNTHRLDKVEDRQDKLDELVSTVKVLAVREQKVESDVEEIKTDVKTLTMKPVKRWDGVVDKIIFTIVGIILAFLFSKIGM